MLAHGKEDNAAARKIGRKDIVVFIVK